MSVCVAWHIAVVSARLRHVSGWLVSIVCQWDTHTIMCMPINLYPTTWGILHICSHRYCNGELSYSVRQRDSGTWPRASCVGLRQRCSAQFPIGWLSCSPHRNHTHSTGRRTASLLPCRTTDETLLTRDRKKHRQSRWFTECTKKVGRRHHRECFQASSSDFESVIDDILRNVSEALDGLTFAHRYLLCTYNTFELFLNQDQDVQ